jgi:hypothetical protein
MKDKRHGWLIGLALFFALPLAAATPHLQIRVGPGADLEQIVKDVPPQSEATITVEAGRYRAHNLWKPGVNWFGAPGAEITWTDAGDAVGIWDDRVRGAGTNFIEWYGTLNYTSTGSADASPGNGVIIITNANTVINAYVSTINSEFTDPRVNPAGTFVVINCRLAILEVDHSYEDLTSSFADSYGSLLYWENGETHLTFKRAICDDGYGLWFKEPAGSPAADVYVNGQYLESRVGVGNPTALWFRGSNANWKGWVTIGEVACVNGGGYALGMDGTGGRLYAKFQKLGNASTAPAILNGGGYLWYEGDKVSSGINWFVGRSNSVSDLHVREWDDHATNISAGFRFEGGQHIIHAGRAKVWNGRGVEHVGGTNRLLNLTVDTFGTNTIATVTNCIPLVMGTGTSNLVLQNCYLRGPIATANGGALSIWGSNAAAHVLNQNSVMNSNAANVHGIITALVTNQTQLR